MKKFLAYLLNYRKNVYRIEQLRSNLKSVDAASSYKLKMAKAAVEDLNNEFTYLRSLK